MRPLAHYVAASVLDELGRTRAEAATPSSGGAIRGSTWAFPYGLDALDALDRAILAEPDDAVAHALLGMLLYAHGRRRDAMRAWERAVELGLNDPVLLRNAALAAYNIAHDDELASGAVRARPPARRMTPASGTSRTSLASRLGHSSRGADSRRCVRSSTLVLTARRLHDRLRARLLVRSGRAVARGLWRFMESRRFRTLGGRRRPHDRGLGRGSRSTSPPMPRGLPVTSRQQPTSPPCHREESLAESRRSTASADRHARYCTIRRGDDP